MGQQGRWRINQAIWVVLLLTLSCGAVLTSAEATSDPTEASTKLDTIIPDTTADPDTTAEPNTTAVPPVLDAPYNITVTKRTTDSLEIAWNQDGVVDNCTVDVSDLGSGSVNPNCTSFTAEITGLPSAGKEYTINVTALQGLEENSSSTVERTRPPVPTLEYKTNDTTTDKIILDVTVPGSDTDCEVDSVTVVAVSDSSPADTVNLTCGEIIQVTFSRLTPGTNYTFEAIADIEGIKSDVSEQLTGPTEPRKPTINDIIPSTDSLKVPWSYTSGENDDLSKEEVEWTCDGSVADPEEVKGGGREYNITGLQPGSTCQVTVTAYTSYGDQDYSARDTEDAWTTAAPPTNFNVEAVDDTALNATWDTPKGNCSSLLITYKEANAPDTNTTSLECDETKLEITGLQGNGEYTVTIQTIHPGNGTDSEKETATAWTIPGIVAALDTSLPTTEEITVSWEIASNDVAENNLVYILSVNDTTEGNQCIQITFSHNGQADGPGGCDNNTKKEEYDNIQSVNYTVEGLDPCITYRFEVYAENDGRLGTADSVYDDTLVGAPVDQVNIISVQPGNSATSMLLEWTRPAEPSRCEIKSSIIRYTYDNCSTNPAQHLEGTLNVTGNGVSATVTGLQAYWNYTFTVESYTEAGVGNSKSNGMMNRTSEAESGPPTDVNVWNFTHEAIVVSWEAPELCVRNGDIVAYNVAWNYTDPTYPNDPTKGGSNSTLVNVTEGTEGTEYMYTIPAKPYKNYTIHIAAINGAGQGATSKEQKEQTEEWFAGQVDVNSINTNISDPYTIRLKWDEPDEPQGIITQYTVSYMYSGDDSPCESYGIETLSCFGEENVTDGDTHVNLTNLQPYQTFEVKVKAWTSVGPGDPAEISEMTDVVAPYKPTEVKVSDITATSLNVSWDRPQHYPGPTNYTVEVIDTGIPKDSQEIVVTGYDNTSVNVIGLDPYWIYTIEVTANTSKDSNKSDDSSEVTTAEADPRAVQYFNVQKKNNSECQEPMLHVYWENLEGKDRRGDIKNYTIMYWDVTAKNDVMSKAFQEEGDDEDGNRTESLGEEDNIKAETEYHFKMAAYSGAMKGADNLLEEEVDAGACPPRFPDGEEVGGTNTNAVRKSENQDSINKEKQFKISVLKDFYTDERNGKITRTGVYVMEDSTQNGQSEIVLEKNLLNRTHFESISELIDNKNPIEPYRVDFTGPGRTENRRYGAVKRSAEKLDGYMDKTIGEVEDCGSKEYCNGYLLAGRSYRVRSFACTDAGCSVTAETDVIPTDPENKAGLIVGSVLGSLILIALIVLIVLLLIRRDIIPFKKRKESETPFPMVVAPEPNNELVERSKPVKVDDFVHHVERLHRDSNFRFAEEYQNIKDHCDQKPAIAAELPANRVKNRYINILPFDETRVKLLPIEDEEGSDYINGNFMMGYTSQREFLAMQGPLPSTIDSFWRVTWEQNCPVIVMVTNLKERDREKCAKYWPDKSGESQMYGEIQVTLRSESFLGDYVIRILDVKQGSETRSIKQFHFISWPDFGCPATTNHLLEFVAIVRSHVRPQSPESYRPIMVHCSAGVGRTGTFIVVDRVLQHMREHDFIDIYSIVMQMRSNRCHMVQTEDQYVYIHDCIRDAIKQGLHRPADEGDHIYANQDFEPDEPEEIEQEALYVNYNPAEHQQVPGDPRG